MAEYSGCGFGEELGLKAFFIELQFEQTDESNRKIKCQVRRSFGFYKPIDTILLWTGVFDT